MSLLVGGTTSAWGITHARVSVASELAPWLSSPPPTPLTQREGPGLKIKGPSGSWTKN